MVDSRRMGFALLSVVLATTGHAIETSAVHARQSPPGFEVAETSIQDLQTALETGVVTSRQLVETYLARIEAYDTKGPRLHAMISLNANAVAEADALDRERAATGPRGPLHGVPIVLKDNYETTALPTSAGSVALAGLRTGRDAFQVRRLREAGAIILGKTNMHELAAGITTVGSLGDRTRNPYDPTRNPGGSSGGTGAAVAASFAAFGMGSDTCGSIRIPSSHNNLVGLRGTRGLSSRTGIVPLSHTQDIGGPLARSVEDLAIALDATVGPDPDDPSTEVGNQRPTGTFRGALGSATVQGARLGLITAQLNGALADRDVIDVVRRAVDDMKQLGAEIVDVEVANLDELTRTSGVIGYEFKFDLMDYLAATPLPPVRTLREILDRGLYHRDLEQTFRRRDATESRDSEDYRKALEAQATLASTLTSVLEEQQLTALVYPTIRRRPAVLGEPQEGSACAISANSGLPAVSMPAGFTEGGLPVGVELLGSAWSDHRLVALAHAFEQATRLRRAPPYAPPLVEGHAPAPVTFEVDATGADVVPAVSAAVVARMRGSFDPVTGEMRYQVAVEGVAPGDVLFAGLHRGGMGEVGPVLHRLVASGEASGTGAIALGPRDRGDLESGRVYLQVETRANASGAARGQITLDAGRRR